MGNVAQTNVSSLNAQRNLFKTNNDLNTTFQRLSSGFRINSAKDDAAGLIISNQLSVQIVSLNVGIRNANDGISLAQTAEGALQEVTNILLRQRELALSAASGQNATNERNALDAEFNALSEEITRISTDTNFGNVNLLDGSASDFAIQVGKDSGQTITVSATDVSVIAASITAAGVDSVTNAAASLAIIDNQISAIDTARGDLGAQQNRLSSTISNLQNVVENVSASRSRIRDTDFAAETANLAKNQVLQQAGLSILSQANASSQSVLSLLQ
jgi:flagellin